jgi:hypothetical protein
MGVGRQQLKGFFLFVVLADRSLSAIVKAAQTLALPDDWNSRFSASSQASCSWPDRAAFAIVRQACSDPRTHPQLSRRYS